MGCIHRWRDTALPGPKLTANELLKSIENAGNTGWWLKKEEFELALILIKENKIQFCKNCHFQAVKEIKNND